MSITSQLMDTLRVELPGALDGAIRMTLFNVTDEFCRTSHALREEHDVALTAGSTTYTLALANRSIVAIFSVSHPTMELSGVTHDLVDGLVVLPAEPTVAEAADPLTFELATAPAPGIVDLADWMPDRVWARYYQAFVHGAKARMMAQPAKPYSNIRLAEYHGRRFRNFMALARHDAAEGGVPAGQAWRFPRFGR